MKTPTKIGLVVLVSLGVLILIPRLSSGKLSLPSLDLVHTFNFSFENDKLKQIVEDDLSDQEGVFAVYIEELPASPSAALSNPKKYGLLENDPFPAASLYKLTLLAAVFKKIEAGQITLEDRISAQKSHLIDVFGAVDFGYEDTPEEISYSVETALERVGRISDNFAAIMLTEKVRVLSKDSPEPLEQIAEELGMNNTNFKGDPETTAFDIFLFFKKLYLNQVVSEQASKKIMELLALSKINDRLPALLPESVKVIHKTGELSRVRHDSGIVFPPQGNPYVIVVLSKDLKYEDQGVEALANLSKDVFDYFVQKPK